MYADAQARHPAGTLDATGRRLAPGGLITQVCRTANTVRGHLERTVLRGAGLNWTAFDVLQLVCSTGGVETRAAAAELAIAKGTLSGVADALSGRGLVQRRRLPADRRLAILEPTDTGLAFTERMQGLVRAEEAALLVRAGVDNGPLLAAVLRSLAAVPRRSRRADRAVPARSS